MYIKMLYSRVAYAYEGGISGFPDMFFQLW